jgi:hypothetical protein
MAYTSEKNGIGGALQKGWRTAATPTDRNKRKESNLQRKAGLMGVPLYFFPDSEEAGFARIGFMAEIIGFPKDKLTRRERERLKEFMREELEDIQNTSCGSRKKEFGDRI